jgi:hypothetical protein
MHLRKTHSALIVEAVGERRTQFSCDYAHKAKRPICSQMLNAIGAKRCGS